MTHSTGVSYLIIMEYINNKLVVYCLKISASRFRKRNYFLQLKKKSVSQNEKKEKKEKKREKCIAWSQCFGPVAVLYGSCGRFDVVYNIQVASIYISFKEDKALMFNAHV